MISIGTKISYYRKSKGLTQESLAERLNVSPQAVSKWENDIACPDIQLLPDISKILEVSIDELLSIQPVKTVQALADGEKKIFEDLTLKVLVNSKQGDKVRINLPMPLVRVAMEIGVNIPQIAENEHLKGIDFNQIIQLVESGVIGRLVEVESADGDTVFIVVE